MNMLSAFDLKILAILQNDARRPVAEIAAEIGLSPPACYRRIRTLRASGTLAREMALVAPSTMGWPISMIVMVTLERDKGWIVDELVATLKAAPEVMDVWYVTGDHDLVLQVAARDMTTYEAFTRRVLHGNDHVGSFKTLVVLQNPKRAAALPPAT